METIEMMPVRVRIASILKKAIYAGEYKSGDELSLTDLAAKLGVSRTPVREAFLSLEAEGLITLRMNRGAIVNTIDKKFIRDRFEMRILLEGEAASLAALNQMDTKDLQRRIEMLEKEGWDHLPEKESSYVSLNAELHLVIWTAAGNEKLKSYLLELWNGPSHQSDEASTLSHYQASTREHLELLDAIERGDAPLAKEIMRGHIKRSMENILAVYS